MKRSLATLLFIIFAVLTVSGSMASQSKNPEPKPQKAIDPVCGLTVDKIADLSSSYKGETYYFCSKKDRDLFKANPDKYLKKPASGR